MIIPNIWENKKWQPNHQPDCHHSWFQVVQVSRLSSFSSLTAASVHKTEVWLLNFLGLKYGDFPFHNGKDLTTWATLHGFVHVPRRDVASICKVHQFMFQRHDGCWEGNDEEDQGHNEQGHLHDSLCPGAKDLQSWVEKKHTSGSQKCWGCLVAQPLLARTIARGDLC